MDGFDYLINIVPDVNDERWGQLQELDAVRKSGMYRFCLYPTPEDLVTLGPQGSYITNLIMAPQTIIYGVLAISPSEAIKPSTAPVINTFTFKAYLEPGFPVVEQYVRSGLGNDWTMRGLDLSGIDPCDKQGLPFQLFSHPIQVLESRIRVELSNPSITDTIRTMVCLICAEPVPALADKAGRNC